MAWSSACVGSMAAAVNVMATATSSLVFLDSAAAQVGPPLLGSATFGVIGATGVITANAVVSASATGNFTLGTALWLTNAGATIGTFLCTSGGTNGFVFGALNITNGDFVRVSSWLVTVSTASA